MNPGPFARFLGIDDDSSAAEFLGLSSETTEPFQIEQALQRRLEMVFNHPEGRSDDAEIVRQALRNAAEELKQRPFKRSGFNAAQSAPARIRPAPPIFNLTAFDRLVLAVLVGCGGWNADSRERLVALASSYGVSVQGLMRVVTGLGQYARSGGPRLGVKEIAGGRALAPMGSSAPGAPLGKPLLDRAAENLAIELQRDGPLATIKLAVLFAALTLLVAIIGLRLVLAGDSKKAQEQPARVEARDIERPTSPSTRRVRDVATADSTSKTRISDFSRYPTFLGNGLPPEAIAAVDECGSLPGELAELVRKLSVAEEPSEAVFRNWDVSVQTIGRAWVLVDVSTRREIERAMFETLREAGDAPSVSDRLLLSLMPTPAITHPLDIWRGAWSAGILASLSNEASLPPVVVERARAQLDLALETKPSPDFRFNDAARIWLDRQTKRLVETIELDPATYDAWELWISAQRGLGRNDQYDRSIANAIRVILLTGTDLAQPGPSANVLGRLVTLLVDNPGAQTYELVREFFETEEITSRDLWVFTSLLALSEKSNWYPDQLVVPENADQRHRWRIRDDLVSVWPNAKVSDSLEPGGTPPALPVNRDLAQRWAQLSQRVIGDTVEARSEALLGWLVRLSRLNEAAHAIENQDDDHARQVIAEIETSASRSPSDQPSQTQPSTSSIAPIKIGQAIGKDGEWSVAYTQAGRNFEQRIDSLRSLRAMAGSDLGPIDAELFVREVYRGSPPDIRLVAQSILTEQFATGPTVMMELLDQLPGAPVTESLSRMIQDLTSQTLPRHKTTDWPVKARLALVRHSLRLRSEAGTSLDAVSEDLIKSYVERLRLLRRERNSTAAPATPQEAAGLLLQAWADRSALTSSSTPVPESLAGLHRRQTTRMRLAGGPIQIFAANQLSILDRMAYVTAAEQPEHCDPLMEMLRQSSRERARMTGVLEQTVQIEQTMLRLWQLRFGIDGAELSTKTPAGESS